MSQRLVNLCDFAAPQMCASTATAKCPLCERDACSFHFGGGFAIISLLIAVSSSSTLTHGGHERLNVCTECVRTLERAGAQNVGDVVAMLRARCAATRLTEIKT